MDIRKKIGLRIRELRVKKRFSQEKLAEEAKITGKHVSSIELGKENPTLDTFVRISSALDVELWELLNYGHELTGEALQKKILRTLKTMKEEDSRLILKFMNTLKK